MNEVSRAPGRVEAAIPRLWVAVGLAVAAGVVLWTSFPPVGFGASAPVGVALLSGAVWTARMRRGIGLGVLSGVVFFLLLLTWMRVVGTDAWLLLALWCGAWFAVIGAGTALVTRLPAAPLWIASVWTLEEALRGRIPWGGFPWGSVSFSQADAVLANWAPVGGLALVSFVVALVGASLTAGALALARGAWRSALLYGLTITLAMLLPSGLAGLAAAEPTDSMTSVAIVQGGTPQRGMGAMDVRRAVLDNHVRQTLDLAAAVDGGAVQRPDFVLWPENSTDIDPFADPTVARDITAAARAVGVPILVGAVTTSTENPDEVWNVGVVWDPESGPSQMYIKTHPVPFGEYIPFRSQLADMIGRFDRIPRDFAAGDRPGNLTIAGVRVGNVICFEIAYADVVDDVVSNGAEVITVQTNNATYGGTAQPDQQLQIERMRASETGRTVLVAATSGISAQISPDRTVVESLAEGEEGWFVASVPLVEGTTWATRAGGVLEWLLALLSVVVLGVWGALRWSAAHRHAP